jgi:flagellar motor protein MotB
MRYRLFLAPLATALLALPAIAGAQSAATGAQPAVTVKEEKPGLLAQAKVQPDKAQQAALGRVANGTITKAEIEQEHKKLIYSYDIAVPGKSGITEVHVDAMTGKVLSTEHEKSEEAAAKPAAATPATAKPASATTKAAAKPAPSSPSATPAPAH